MSRRIVYQAFKGIDHYEFPYDIKSGLSVTVKTEYYERVLTKDVDYTFDSVNGGGVVVHILYSIEEGDKVILESGQSSHLVTSKGAPPPIVKEELDIPDRVDQQIDIPENKAVTTLTTLDEKTLKVIEDIREAQKKIGHLNAYENPGDSYYGVDFINSEGVNTARIEKQEAGIVIGNIVPQENGRRIFQGSIDIRTDGSIYFNREKLIEWADSAGSLRKNINAITPQEVLSLLQGRTVLKPMHGRLGRVEIGTVKKFTTSDCWYFWGESTNGYTSSNLGTSINLTKEEASSKWKCVGLSRYEYTSYTTSWWQEVIDTDDTILKTVTSYTLQDNIIDLKAISSKITALEDRPAGGSGGGASTKGEKGLRGIKGEKGDTVIPERVLSQDAIGNKAGFSVVLGGLAIFGCVNPVTNKINVGWIIGKYGDISILRPEGISATLVNPNSIAPLEDIRKNIGAISLKIINSML